MKLLARNIASAAATALLITACTGASTDVPDQRAARASATLIAPTDASSHASPDARADASPDASSGSAGSGRVTGPAVVAVGDIACPPGAAVTRTTCQQAATARLARTYDPRYVLGLGDMQYDVGALSAFQNSYHDSWGTLKSVTRPVPGNHEYRTSGANGYFSYFTNQEPGGPGYYAFNIDKWRIYALNSNCAEIDCETELAWMGRDLADHPRRCSAITLHHPRFSSGGEHGNAPEARRFWNVAYRHGVDVALAGHDHDYERFRRMDPSGTPATDGLFSFVSGAGGKSLYQFGNVVGGSLVRYNQRPGVLALTLGAGEFAFEFKSIDGDLIDHGARTCR